MELNENCKDMMNKEFTIVLTLCDDSDNKHCLPLSLALPMLAEVHLRSLFLVLNSLFYLLSSSLICLQFFTQSLNC